MCCQKGRLTVGVGVGWTLEEIVLLGGPPFAERAQASEEYVQAVQDLFQQGLYAAFDKLLFAPKSAQLPRAPMGWGRSRARVGARVGGNGWYPVAANPRIPLETPQLYGDALAEVRAEAERAFRDPGQILGAILAIYCRIGTEQQGREGGRLAFTGSVQAVVDDIGYFQERGLQHCVIGGDGKDLQGTLELLRRFAAKVMAKCD